MQPTHPFYTLKFCPKCGSPGFEVSGTSSLECSACGFHFFINSAAAVAALIEDEQGKLLLTTRGIEPDYGKLDLPGGFADPGETAEEAVERELREELGMKVKSLEYFASAPNEYIYSEYSVFTLDFAFRVIPESFTDLKAMDDILGFRFYAPEEIDFSKVAAPSITGFIQQFFRK